MLSNKNEISKTNIRNYFIFTALSRDYDKTIDPRSTNIFFILSLGFMGVFAGIRGMLFSAFSRAGYHYDWQLDRLIWDQPVYNPVVAIESGTLEIAYFLILFFIYQYLNASVSNNRSIITHDIALLAQVFTIKDILFILYTGLYSLLPFDPTNNGWGWNTKPLNLYNFGLYWFFVLFLIVFFLPRIMNRIKTSYQEYDKRLFVSITISILIFVVTALFHSIIKILIDLPLGLG